VETRSVRRVLARDAGVVARHDLAPALAHEGRVTDLLRPVRHAFALHPDVDRFAAVRVRLRVARRIQRQAQQERGRKFGRRAAPHQRELVLLLHGAPLVGATGACVRAARERRQRHLAQLRQIGHCLIGFLDRQDLFGRHEQVGMHALLRRVELRARVDALVATRPVHILVNNTGGPPGGPVASAPAEAFLDAFGRHLLANQALAQATVPGMRAAGWGRIVNVVSTSVYEPIAGLGVSNTIRGAVAGWAKTLSRELGPDGITVNNVLPGYTETGRIEQILQDRTAATGKSREEVVAAMLASVPAGRFAKPEETAGVIAFLCSPAAGYVNGVSLAVDGGRMQSI